MAKILIFFHCTVHIKLLLSGSFHTASKHNLPIWAQTATGLAFNWTREEKFVNKRGVYDKLIIECALREDLRRRKLPDSVGGCEGFHPSLTTNGMCYTFNGKRTSDLWMSSEMIKTFSTLFTSDSENQKNFGGSRSVQGN